MSSSQIIAVAAAALALNPNDAAAREEMARALARQGVTANANDATPPEAKNDASAELWRLTNEDADNRPREEYRETCANFVATHSPDEITDTIKNLTGAVRNAKSADLRRYFQRYAEQVVANEGSDDDRHQEEASSQARDFTDPTDADEVRAAVDAIEGANNFACLFDLDEYESNFGGNDLPETFRNMLRAVTECLDFEAINRRAAPDRDDAEGAAAVIYDAAHEDDEDEEDNEDFDPSAEQETPDQDGAL